MTTTKERDLWRLGLAMSACSRGAGGGRARPKPAALTAVKDVIDALGVRISASALRDEEARARARAEIESAAARLYGAGAAPIATLGWAAGDLLPWAGIHRGSCDPPTPVDPWTAEAAQRFLQASTSLAEPARSELEEVRGWCDAIVGGWVVQFRAKELCELIDEPFKDAAEAEPVDADADEPSTLKTATPAHVIEMIVMHHIVCSLYALLGDPVSEFRGSVREGEHMYDDCSESRFLVGWNEHGVVGLAFHKYAGSEEGDTPPEQRDPMRHVPGIPEELRALATKLSNQVDRWWTAGFYLTKGARRIEPGISVDGSEHFKILVGPARAALFQRPGQWVALRSITPDQGELARTLAKRAMAGGGTFTDEEIAIALGTGPEMDQQAQPWLKEKNVERVAAEFAKLGLTLAVPADVLERARAARRAEIEARIAEALTPDERALLEAAHANDANTVRQLLARGVSPNVGYVADMFEDFPAFEGMPALMVALRSHAHDAALALIDGGADVTWQIRGGRLTAFTSAVSAGDVDIARRLVEGLPNKSEEIAAALWSAALRGERAMVDFLLESGAARAPHPRATLRLQQLRDRGQAEIADLLERVIVDATPKEG